MITRMTSEEEISRLVHLCRIECTEEEKRALASHLDKVLDYVNQLNAVDVSQVEPCLSVLDGMPGPLREDEVGPTLSVQEFLSNAPAHVGGMIKVPPVLK